MTKHVMKALADELLERGVITQKSAMTTADLQSSGLKNEDAERFINSVVGESVLLSNIRVHRTDSPSGDISKLNFTGPVTQKATEATTFTDTSKPVNTTVSYVTKKTVSAIDISGEVTEDNIEGQGGRQTIMDAMTTKIANDMETLAIEGDDSIAGTSAIEKLLKTNDGFHIQTASGSGAHLVSAAGRRASMLFLMGMLRNLPTKYRKNLDRLRWIMSSNVALDLQQELAALNPGYALGNGGALADQLKVSGGLPKLHGIMPLVVPLLPEDLTLDGTAGDTGSFIWLTDPNNLIYVVQRDMTIEWERVARKDAWEATVHMRTDFIIEEIDAVVKGVNVNTNTAAAAYGAS